MNIQEHHKLRSFEEVPVARKKIFIQHIKEEELTYVAQLLALY
jgi:hypothetical protein